MPRCVATQQQCLLGRGRDRQLQRDWRQEGALVTRETSRGTRGSSAPLWLEWAPGGLGWASQLTLLVKNPSAKAGDSGSIPGSGRSPAGRGDPLQYSFLVNFHTPQGRRGWDKTEVTQHGAWGKCLVRLVMGAGCRGSRHWPGRGQTEGKRTTLLRGPTLSILCSWHLPPASPDGSSLKRTSFLTPSTENSAFPEKFCDKRVMRAWRSGVSVMSESLWPHGL